MSRSEELRVKLAYARTQAKDCNDQIKKLEEQLKETKARLKELTGYVPGSYGKSYGLIDRLKSEIEKAERQEADDKALPVIWKEEPCFGKDERHVVRKITKKRIYTARHGAERMSYFKKDGTGNHSTDGSIDLEKTFGKDYEDLLS